MRELEPGAMLALMLAQVEVIEAKVPAALTAIALGLQKQAVINASTGAHVYGTKTPAWPGTGPARISGTLVRSIAHSGVRQIASGWEVRVGLIHGQYPTYRTSGGSYTSKTPSHEYGEYLERGLRNGATYPWLLPAFHHAIRIVTPVVMAKLFI
jgi:hypothetical protein